MMNNPGCESFHCISTTKGSQERNLCTHIYNENCSSMDCMGHWGWLTPFCILAWKQLMGTAMAPDRWKRHLCLKIRQIIVLIGWDYHYWALTIAQSICKSLFLKRDSSSKTHQSRREKSHRKLLNIPFSMSMCWHTEAVINWYKLLPHLAWHTLRHL